MIGPVSVAIVDTNRRNNPSTNGRISYFDHLPAGKVVSRITSDTESAVRIFYVTGISTLLSTIVTLIGVYIAIFMLHAGLAAALLVLIPLMLLWQKDNRSTTAQTIFSKSRII